MPINPVKKLFHYVLTLRVLSLNYRPERRTVTGSVRQKAKPKRSMQFVCNDE